MLVTKKKGRNASNEWLKKKNEARSKLLTTLNPILQKYITMIIKFIYNPLVVLQNKEL